MNGDLMMVWVRGIWNKHTKCRKSLFVMDSLHAHCTEDIQDLLVKLIQRWP